MCFLLIGMAMCFHPTSCSWALVDVSLDVPHPQVVPDSDAWLRLRHLLSSSNTEVRKKTCQLIDSTTGGNTEQTRAMIDADIVPVLIKLLDDMDWDIRQVCNLFAAH